MAKGFKTGGRKLGSRNKNPEIATVVLKGWAESYGLGFIQSVAENEKNPVPVRVGAAIYVIDRELGKPRIVGELGVTHRALLSVEHLESLINLSKTLLAGQDVKSLPNGT